MSVQVTGTPLPCGMCERPPAAGDNLEKIRVTLADIEGKRHPKKGLPGLYQCCPDCFDAIKPVVAARVAKELGKDADKLSMKELM